MTQACFNHNDCKYTFTLVSRELTTANQKHRLLYQTLLLPKIPYFGLFRTWRCTGRGEKEGWTPVSKMGMNKSNERFHVKLGIGPWLRG